MLTKRAAIRRKLDSDLAELYGISVKRLNQQVKRNPDRFPADFMFQVTAEEYTALRLQIATSKPGRGGRQQVRHGNAGLQAKRHRLRRRAADSQQQQQARPHHRLHPRLSALIRTRSGWRRNQRWTRGLRGVRPNGNQAFGYRFRSRARSVPQGGWTTAGR